MSRLARGNTLGIISRAKNDFGESFKYSSQKEVIVVPTVQASVALNNKLSRLHIG